MEKSSLFKREFQNLQKYVKWEFDWLNILRFNYFFYGLIVGFPIDQPYGRFLFSVTGGCHRLWSHGSYKANLPLRIFLAFCNTISVQRSIYKWCRIHRLHHKFTDSDADPHNSRRGLFFAHFGWMWIKPHPDVEKYGKKIDRSDLEKDQVVMFQHKYYPILVLIFAFMVPMSILIKWGTSAHYAFNMVLVSQLIVSQCVWLVNSYAHKWGDKPFDKHMNATDSFPLTLIILGDGFHNYHHVFPYDYRSSEFGTRWCNFTTTFIDFMAKIGWATDLKIMSDEIIRKRVLRTGDGSHRYSKENSMLLIPHEEETDRVWGWQDKTVTDEEKRDVEIINKTSNL